MIVLEKFLKIRENRFFWQNAIFASFGTEISIYLKRLAGSYLDDFWEGFWGRAEGFLFLFIFAGISDFFEASYGDFIRTSMG